MKIFLDTVETIEEGLGFSHYDGTHFAWLIGILMVVVVCCIWYRKMDDKQKGIWKKTVAVLLLADELFKVVMLIVGGRYLPDYLPLHLCSINIFMIAIHAWKPSRLLSNFLYTVCIPGALAALLFPTWTSLPVLNFMHLHSFTVHLLLILYPIVLTVCGELNPTARSIPRCLLFLAGMAVIALGVNLILDTNFMFLMYAEEGNPLYIFEQLWGSHLLGFPVLITAVLLVMYLPLELWRKFKK